MSTLPFGIVLLLALLVSAVVSFAATPLVKRMAYKLGAIDVPKDNRRMHKEPIPRMGGLAIAISFILTVLIFGELDRQMRGILLGAVIIVVLGVLDDCLTLRALFKFLVQIGAACVVVAHGCTIQFLSNPVFTSDVPYLDLGNWSVPITIIWIVAITNAVNFIDGLDGLAVGVSAISAATLLVIALLVSESAVAVVLAALLGACLGFLPYNFNPAKIFMGDTGSTFLGFILRLARHQNPMQADRGHIHHRLIDMGFSQKQAVAITYMLTAMLGLAAVVLTSSGEARALILIGAIFVVGAIGFGLIFRHNAKPHDPKPPDKEEVQSK